MDCDTDTEIETVEAVEPVEPATPMLIDHSEERKYFHLLGKFIGENTATFRIYQDGDGDVPQVDPDVQSAINLAAEAVFKRLARIAMNDLPRRVVAD